MKMQAIHSGSEVGAKLPQFNCVAISCGSMTIAMAESRNSDGSLLDGEVELWSSAYPMRDQNVPVHGKK